MNLPYTKEQLQAKINSYRKKYGTSIAWDTILTNVKTFLDSRDYILTFELLNWHGFLGYLSSIEQTIDLFGYVSKGTFHRIFVMFGRAFLEEQEILSTKEATKIGLRWIFPEESQCFKAGNGKPGDIDFEDRAGNTYDVKNDFVSFEKAHKADFILRYNSRTGYVEKHEKPEIESQGSYQGTFCVGRPLADLAAEYGLDLILFDKNSSEEDIERYLGLID